MPNPCSGHACLHSRSDVSQYSGNNVGPQTEFLKATDIKACACSKKNMLDKNLLIGTQICMISIFAPFLYIVSMFMEILAIFYAQCF